MPFTPFHMGAGLLVKAVMQTSFSLMIFGWVQIVMDIQPLVVLITGEGHLHGFSHTFIGASLIAIAGAVSGKYITQYIVNFINDFTSDKPIITISWSIALISAFFGGFSHVILDAIMHSDVQPFFPITAANTMLGFISVTLLHKVLLYSGLLGAALYYVILISKRK